MLSKTYLIENLVNKFYANRFFCTFACYFKPTNKNQHEIIVF